MQRALANCRQSQQRLLESINRTQTSLHENQQKIDTLVETITSGTATADLMVILNEKAGELDVKGKSCGASCTASTNPWCRSRMISM